jgi:hypothetical protein
MKLVKLVSIACLFALLFVVAPGFAAETEHGRDDYESEKKDWGRRD